MNTLLATTKGAVISCNMAAEHFISQNSLIYHKVFQMEPNNMKQVTKYTQGKYSQKKLLLLHWNNEISLCDHVDFFSSIHN